MYRFRGMTAVVSVVPSLVIRTRGVEVKLVGAHEGHLERHDLSSGPCRATVMATTNSPWSEYDDSAL